MTFPGQACPTSNPPTSRLAVIIPVLNEAEVIGRVLDEIPSGAASRVLVVDGGSTDGTASVARVHGAEVVEASRGYGAACWAGAQQAADCDILVFLDGDYSDPPGEIERLVQPVRSGAADLVLGCRDFAPGALPLHARLGNRLVLAIVQVLVGVALSDLPSYKALSRQAFRTLDMRERTYGWTTEMLVKAARRQLRIVEVRVSYRERAGGRSKVSGTIRGTLGAGYKLVTTVIRYARS